MGLINYFLYFRS